MNMNMVSSPPLVLTQFDGASTMNSIMRDGGYSLVTNIVEIKTKESIMMSTVVIDQRMFVI